MTRGASLTARGVLACVLLFQIWLLAPELALVPTPLNDDALHIPASLKARDLLRVDPAGALDPWFSYWSLGYPLWHAYQPLPHLITGALGLAVPDGEFPALYGALKFSLLLAFPLCVFAGARWIGFTRGEAAAAAAIAPLLSTESLYGLEYGSYVWRGSGLYTQLWAMDLLPLAIGAGVRAIRGRASRLPAAILLGLTILSHAIYAYVAAASLAIAAAVVRREVGLVRALARVAVVVAVAAILTAFFTVPMLLDGDAINHSRWESAFKWDSFGHEWVLGRLLGGELLDHGRFPVVTMLAGAGLLRAAARRASAALRFAAAGFMAWVALYFGRPTWGVLLRLAGIPLDLHLHRLIGGLHLFAILLAGSALAALMTWVRERRPGRAGAMAAASVGLIALAPAATERHAFVREGDGWAASSERAIAAERNDLEGLATHLAELQGRAPGRIYPGLAAGWGKEFKTGSVPIYARLSLGRFDALAFLYHSMSRSGDTMVLFDETRPAEYGVFDVRYAVYDASHPAPDFLKPVATHGRFRIFEGPSSGRIGAGTVACRIAGGSEGVYDWSSAWLKSGLPEIREYGVFVERPEGDGAPVVRRGDPFPAIRLPLTVPSMTVGGIRRVGDDWSAEVDLASRGVVVLKESYHPGWRVDVDGRRGETVMVTPGFVGVEVAAGRHTVSFRYRASPAKWALLALTAAGVPLLVAGAALSRRRCPSPFPSPPESAAPPREWAGVLLRALFVGVVLVGALPLLQGKLLAGHDALEYPPRLVEFHENVSHGILLPAWAPDLGNGFGQPLFLFSPPLYYWAAEVFHLAGSGLALSIGLGALAFYLLAGAGAYLAGREAWGRRGGVISAAAFLMAPHVLLDLYVRGNFAELAAVACFPWVAFSLLRLRGRAGLAAGVPFLAVSVSAVALSHVGALVIVLLWLGAAGAGLALVDRDPRLVARAALGGLLGLGLAGFFLVPCRALLDRTKADLLRSDALAFDQHFVEPAQLLASPWGYGLSVPGAGDGMSFSLGWAHLSLAAIGGAGLLLSRRVRPGLFVVLVATAVGFALFTTSLASPIWRALTPLQYLAYPWRCLSAASLSLSLAAGVLGRIEMPRAPGRLLAAAAVAALLLWGYGKARPRDVLTFDDDYYAPARIASLGINTTTREEYEPRTVVRRPPHAESGLESTSGGPIFVLKSSGTPWHRRFRITADAEATIAVNVFAFPGWSATLDGAPLATHAEPETGRLVIALPEGAHDLSIAYGWTGARWAGTGVSVASIGALAVMGAVAARRRREAKA
ncbi:MAG: hypothetical protein HY049_05610 [Acidobacteria bacterium]|nr:hypothetical protein [Acidobacteriota bacterium]